MQDSNEIWNLGFDEFTILQNFRVEELSTLAGKGTWVVVVGRLELRKSISGIQQQGHSSSKIRKSVQNAPSVLTDLYVSFTITLKGRKIVSTQYFVPVATASYHFDLSRI